MIDVRILARLVFHASCLPMLATEHNVTLQRLLIEQILAIEAARFLSCGMLIDKIIS